MEVPCGSWKIFPSEIFPWVTLFPMENPLYICNFSITMTYSAKWFNGINKTLFDIILNTSTQSIFKAFNKI